LVCVLGNMSGATQACAAVCRNPAAGVSGRRAESASRRGGHKKNGARVLDGKAAWKRRGAATHASSSATAAAGGTGAYRPAARGSSSSAPAASLFTRRPARRHLVGALAEDRPVGAGGIPIPPRPNNGDGDDEEGGDDNLVLEGVSSNVVASAAPAVTPGKNGASGAAHSASPSSPQPPAAVSYNNNTTGSNNTSNTTGSTGSAQLASAASAFDAMSQAQIDSVLPTGVNGQYIQGAALSNARDNTEPYWLAPLGGAAQVRESS
jgi:hypothetical protein